MSKLFRTVSVFGSVLVITLFFSLAPNQEANADASEFPISEFGIVMNSPAESHDNGMYFHNLDCHYVTIAPDVELDSQIHISRTEKDIEALVHNESGNLPIVGTVEERDGHPYLTKVRYMTQEEYRESVSSDEYQNNLWRFNSAKSNGGETLTPEAKPVVNLIQDVDLPDRCDINTQISCLVTPERDYGFESPGNWNGPWNGVRVARSFKERSDFYDRDNNIHSLRGNMAVQYSPSIDFVVASIY